jgi:hypothetical protein
MPMRYAAPTFLVLIAAAPRASADASRNDAPGDSSTVVITPPARPLDANAPPAGQAVMFQQVQSGLSTSGAPLWAGVGSAAISMAGGTLGLSRAFSLGLFGGSAFMSGTLSVMSSQLSLRPPPILGIQPTLSLGYSQLLSGPTGFGEIGARYAEGPWHFGWHLHFAERFGILGLPSITSASYASYVTSRWDVGIDHLAQLALGGNVLRTGSQYVDVSAGLKAMPGGPTVRAGTSIPLQPVAAPSNRFSVFGTF